MTFASTSAPLPADASANWVGIVFRELGRSQASGFLLDVALWTVLGALVGLLFAVLSCVFFSRLGWYDVNMRFARGVRWTVFSLIVALSAVLFGLAGLWSGALGGSERVLSKSQLATDVFPRVADVVADAMAWVQIQAVTNSDTNSAEITARLEEFRAGKWELHASLFLQQLDQLQEETITNLVSRLEYSIFQNVPQLKGTAGEKLLRQSVSGLGRALLEKKVASEIHGWGADRIYSTLREQLKMQAAKTAPADTIGRTEISRLLVHEAIIPGIMAAIRSTARAQQMPLLALAAAVMILPPLCIRFLKGRFARRARTTPVTEAPPVIP